jgi:hypothetical protein
MEEIPVELITFDPGFKLDVDFDILRSAADAWFDTLVQVLNGLTIPNFSNGSDYMEDNHFYIEQRVDNV